MANDVQGFIVLLVIVAAVVLVGTVGRLWILRHRPRTFAVSFSDTAFVLFSVLMLIAIGLAFDGVNSELHIEHKYGASEVDAKLLTHKYLKEFFVISVFCTTQLWLLKAAFLGYYWSLRGAMSRNMQIFLYTVSAYTTLTYFGVISLQLGFCLPMSRNWSTGPNKCISVQTVAGMIVQQGTNITSDILILTIPLLTIRSLHSNYGLGRKDLYALAFVFFVGFLSIIASVARFTQVYHVVIYSDNSILAVRRTVIWAVIDKLFAFTAFCLPSLRVLYRSRHDVMYMEKGSGGLTESVSSGS